MTKIKLDYPLYDSVYGDDFPTEQYFLATFQALPSRNNLPGFYDFDVMGYLIQNGFVAESTISTYNRRIENQLYFFFTNKKKQIFIVLNNISDKKDKLLKMTVFFNLQNGEINEQLNFGELENFNKVKSKSNISLLKNEAGYLDIEDYDLSIPELNLELNYGESFLKIHNTIVNRLNVNYDKGIIFLHGDPGTGKTTYIKFLTSLIKNKEILFIPPSMAEMLAEPSIIPFLMDHKNSILLIEDGERVISDRENNGSSAGVSNILNLTDGILGDCLGIQIIATFNMKREKIDQALLRKGRLIAEHKFDKLNVKDTNKLLQHLGKNYKSNEAMVLADIYNIDVETFKTEEKKNKIGFNTN